MKTLRKRYKLLIILSFFALLPLSFYISQRFGAHRTGYFLPDYPPVELNETSDYETVFTQTGLGQPAVDYLLSADNFAAVQTAQDAFFHPPVAACTPLLGWFTREDRFLLDHESPLVDLQPGDIILTLSTHTAGWRHGHAGLVIDQNTVLECIVLGTRSTLVGIDHWDSYSNYAVLRVKNVTPDLQRQVVEFSLTHLLDVPYRLTAGLIGSKAPQPDVTWFGLHCSYLVWYAWNQFGYDLDSDGGRLVSTYDLLCSDQLEIVQIYGLDPRIFLNQNRR